MSRKALVKKAGVKRKSGPPVTPNRGLLLLLSLGSLRHAEGAKKADQAPFLHKTHEK
jgi:hypothetical protein